MRFRFLASLVLLVVAPVAALGVLANRLMADEQAGLQRQVARVMRGDLQRVADQVDALLSRRAETVADQLPRPEDTPSSLRARLRQTPWISAFFHQAPDGSLVYPNPKAAMTGAERMFLARSQQLWRRASQFTKPAEDGAQQPDHGWYPWLHEHGLHLIVWSRSGDGSVRGAELDRMRFLADLIAALPSGDAVTGERRVLRDARGEIIYQWGDHEPGADEASVAEVPLAPPLRGWKIETYLSHSAFAGRMGGGTRLAVFGGIGALAIALALVAFTLFRSAERARREAEQRVTFVNQVSHELKTPLTNIRMYAELLEGRLGDDQPRARRDLSVIVSESQRLSRLINNVLAHARQGRGELKLRPVLRSPDEVITEVLEQFAPSLARAGVTVETELGADEAIRFDADVVGQVLANLISNVEKYAASGGRLRVRSRLSDGGVEIAVRDWGPGISPAFKSRLFEPFQRATDSLTEGASGTGIGLALSRDLARLHGGNIDYIQVDSGSLFNFSFRSV